MNIYSALISAALVAAATQALAAEAPARPDAASGPWTKLGGIPGGFIGRIAIDPASPSTMLAGAVGGLIFKSTNGGASFTPVTVGGPFEYFRAITFDPKSAKTAFAFSAGTNAHIYKSLDSGGTWTALPHQPIGPDKIPLQYGRSILVDPTGKIIVVADRSEGIFRSTNLGGAWTNPLPGRSAARTFAMVQDPNTPTTLWAGGYDASNNYDGVLWKSTDFGATWTEVTVPALDQTTGPIPYALCIVPKTGQIVVSWFGNDPNTFATVGGVVSSADGGVTWSNSSTGLPTNLDDGNALVADPETPTTLYLTTNGMTYPNGLFQSLDAGMTWNSLGTVIGGGNGFFTAAARPASAKLPAAVFAGGSDLFASTNQGVSWTREDNGIAIGTISEVSDDLLNSGGLYAGTADGLFHSTDGGQTWSRISNWTGATVPTWFTVDPVTKTHPIYAATASGVWQSTNEGRTWTSLKLPGSPTNIAYLAADPVKAGRVYAADNGHTLYRSDNDGKTWTSATVGTSTDVFTASPAPFALDPAETGVVYAAVPSGLLSSRNAGKTWTPTKLSPSLGSFLTISMLPGASTATSTLFVETQTNGAWSLEGSSNAGKTWKTVTHPFAASDGCSPATACQGDNFYLTAAPAAGQLLAYHYGGNAPSAVVRSTDGGMTWTVVDAQIQSLITNITVSAGTGSVFIGDGNGNTYAAPYASLTSAIDDAFPQDRAARRTASDRSPKRGHQLEQEP